MFEPLPALIRLQRQTQGLTIDQLAALSGVSRTRIVGLEKGEANVSLDILLKIANALRMKQLRIGGLLVEGATQDDHVAVAAAEAIQALQRIIDDAEDAQSDLRRAAGPISTLLSPLVHGEKSLDPEPQAGAKRRRKARK